MKILFAGLGSIGRRHLRNLLALGEDDILLYRTHKSTLADDELKGFPTETELARALAHHPQAVIIANPTALHLEVALAAAEAGCHLFIEKPISHTLQGVDALFNVVQRNNVRVLVGFQFRFHKGLQKVKQWLQEGVIGQTLTLRAHYGDYLPGWHPWEDYHHSYSARVDLGGGVVLTLSHPLDYCRWLLGEVQSLYAFTARQQDLDIDVEDTAEIGLRFANGVLGSVHLNYLQRPSTHWLQVAGSEGVIHWNYERDEVKLHHLSQPERVICGAQPDIRNPMFLAEMRHFLAVVRGEEESACTLDDGMHALELALAVQQSSAEKRFIDLTNKDIKRYKENKFKDNSP